MNEFILKTNVPPPEGWEYTGEFRKVSDGEWYLYHGNALRWDARGFSADCYPILRRKRWVPKMGDKYWYVNACGISSTSYEECAWDMEKVKCDNCWRTKEKAQEYFDACRKLAQKMQDAVQDN